MQIAKKMYGRDVAFCLFVRKKTTKKGETMKRGLDQKFMKMKQKIKIFTFASSRTSFLRH